MVIVCEVCGWNMDEDIRYCYDCGENRAGMTLKEYEKCEKDMQNIKEEWEKM